MTIHNFDTTLAAARTGANWAWANLYRSLAPVLTGYMRAQGAPDPEDLTAEVFVQVVRSLGTFDGDEAGFRSWVFVIAHRKLLDDRRYRGRRPALQAADVSRAGPTGDVEQEAMRSLGRGEVVRLLNELTEDQRNVMLLRIIAGLSTRQAAEVLRKRQGSVESLQHRALQRLRKLMAP